jgi:hypothetical protein
MADAENWQAWFEHAWQVREDEIYPRLFGDNDQQICVLTPEIFDRFGQAAESIDPRWLHYGVLPYPPNERRQSWAYVSSGLSNAWEADTPDPSGPSGMGMEFVFQTPDFEEWAVRRLLHLVAFQILLAHDRYPGKDILDVFHRLSVGGSLATQQSELSCLMVGPADGFDERIQLPSGWVDLLSIIGITDGETAYAKQNGGDKLVALLRGQGAFPITDWRRKSLASAG